MNTTAAVLPQFPIADPSEIAFPKVPQGDVQSSPVVANALPAAIREGEAPAEPRWLTVLSRLAPWITGCYVIGAFCFLLRLTIALWGGHRLRTTEERLTDSRLIELITVEARKVGLRLVPVVAYCERVAVPTVVGILRPVVLLPASIMTGLTSEEFAAIISHEFAHIRRHDLWVNLLQRVIESLLFFHPVVWFVSRRLSAEREICCDDLVVRSGCTPMNYAGALLRMAELCVTRKSSPLAALSAGGHSQKELENRIERLLNQRSESALRLTRNGFAIIAMIVISSAAATAMMIGPAGHDTLDESQLPNDDQPVNPNRSGGEKVDFAEPAVRIGQFPLNDTPSVDGKHVQEGTILPFWSTQTTSANNGGPQPNQSVDDVELKYPHCILNIDDLKERSLAEAIVTFNSEALKSPLGQRQPPITEQETRDAIAKFVEPDYVPDSVKAVFREIATTGTLPANVYFRRFTRFDDEQQMHGVWWVRLVVESKEPPIYSVPVRTTAMKSRPYTQMERQQNAEDGVTLINRFVSYFAELPNILLLAEFPKAAIDRLVSSAETSIKAKDLEAFQSLFEWNGVSDSTRAFVKSEFAMLTGSTIHSIKVTPRNFRGE
ncbi:MAG: M56 family metallopeptidase, partial [Planctomycetota bacterium]|nr:M56 family metallopeptidase [Planctomycetota bacterium]